VTWPVKDVDVAGQERDVAGKRVDDLAPVGEHGWSPRNWRVSSRNSPALPSAIRP
jgi:hypothetical protein